MFTKNNHTQIESFVKLLQIKRYSESTIKNYKSCLLLFSKDFKEINFEQIPDRSIVNYFNFLVKKRNVSFSYQKMMAGSIKLFYIELFKRKVPYKLLVPSRPQNPLPKTLSKPEIKKIIDMCSNTKHKAILLLAYSAGLRVSEVINLKIKDIDSARKLIHIKNSKNNADRIVMLSKVLIDQLRLYYLQYKPKNYLFEGENAEQYSVRSAQAVFKQCAKRAGIKKDVSFHSLRHSFASHLLENGTDIRVIMEFLGHKNINTTLVYTKITDVQKLQIKSPADGIGLQI